MDKDIFNQKLLDKLIFKLNPENNYLVSRESSKIEFKESFNFAEIAEYLRDFAAFANNSGGYLIFGVEDSPHKLCGINGEAFEKIDEQKITGYINEYFAPTIEWQKHTLKVNDRSVGLIYIWPSVDKPVVAFKDGGRKQEIKNGEIYYRYIGRSQKIRFPELKKILDDKLHVERKSWQEHIERMVRIGPTNAAILDTAKGKIESSAGVVLIDDELIPKLKFIREGQFVEKRGKPTLKLVGQLKPTSLVEKVVHDDPYIYKSSDVSKKVESLIGKPFKNHHHTNAWRHYKIREQSPDGSINCNPKYCDYKKTINYFLYSQEWVDFLVAQLKKDEIYKKLVK